MIQIIQYMCQRPNTMQKRSLVSESVIHRPRTHCHSQRIHRQEAKLSLG